ncbi:enoyl-CoA hydratase-related protein, partial [uncultured Aeromicrobium sp.]|uniref:enoyl-CoA hydratase-related protein n=1 Tax=uncultured Aeromicrobium sp. TaxID=337820 RepID=UPI0025FA19BE
LSARTFDAAEAAAIGLVTRAVPDDELDAAARGVVGELAAGSPQGLRETKRLLNADLVARIDRDGEDVARQSAALFGSEEARAAMAAFLARKK